MEGGKLAEFSQLLQMQHITICLRNANYFQPGFNSFPNMTQSWGKCGLARPARASLEWASWGQMV